MSSPLKKPAGKKPGETQLIGTAEVLSLPLEDVFDRLHASQLGLGTEEAERRLEEYGTNDVAEEKERTLVFEFLSRFMNPLVLTLIGAALISTFLGEHINSTIIFSIIVASVVLDFFQEHRAEKAAEALRNRVATTTAVLTMPRVRRSRDTLADVEGEEV